MKNTQNSLHVLITDKVHPLLIDGLKDMGIEVTYDTSVDNKILANIITAYDGLVINSKILMDKGMIDRNPGLKFIARLGSGMEIIDKPYAESLGIACINSPEGNRNAVAEHAMAMLLCLANNLIKANAEVKSMVWKREENRGFELEGKTIGIIGYGHTGRSFGEKLSAWNTNVIAYDKYLPSNHEMGHNVARVDIADIFLKADVITLHLPLTPETKYFVDESFLKKSKDGIIILNTSRGQVIHTPSLIDALNSGKIWGACLDVFENEKPENYSKEEQLLYQQLFSFDRVICSPHIAGWTKESLEKIASVTLSKVKKAIKF